MRCFCWQGLRPRPVANNKHGLNFQFPQIPLHPRRMMGTATLTVQLGFCSSLRGRRAPRWRNSTWWKRQVVEQSTVHNHSCKKLYIIELEVVAAGVEGIREMGSDYWGAQGFFLRWQRWSQSRLVMVAQLCHYIKITKLYTLKAKSYTCELCLKLLKNHIYIFL